MKFVKNLKFTLHIGITNINFLSIEKEHNILMVHNNVHHKLKKLQGFYVNYFFGIFLLSATSVN